MAWPTNLVKRNLTHTGKFKEKIIKCHNRRAQLPLKLNNNFKKWLSATSGHAVSLQLGTTGSSELVYKEAGLDLTSASPTQRMSVDKSVPSLIVENITSTWPLCNPINLLSLHIFYPQNIFALVIINHPYAERFLQFFKLLNPLRDRWILMI